jgi:glutamate synthase (NADPH/NADH) large chain
VILGQVGANFGAGMTGGLAYVYDPSGDFANRINPESLIWQRIEVDHYEQELKALIEEHVDETQSQIGKQILVNWDQEIGNFLQVVPKEMLNKLDIAVTRKQVKSA